MLRVEQWAEVRRLVLVERRSQREVARLMGLARDTVAKALASAAKTETRCWFRAAARLLDTPRRG